MCNILEQWSSCAFRDIEEFGKVACATVNEATHAIGEFVETHYDLAKRNIIVLTFKMGGAEASDYALRAIRVIEEVVKRSFFAAPVTLFAIFAPSYLFVGAWAGFAVAHLVFDKPFSATAYNDLNMGMGNSMTIRAAENAAAFVATGNLGSAVAGIINLISAAYWYNSVSTAPALTEETDPLEIPSEPLDGIPADLEIPKEPIDGSIVNLDADDEETEEDLTLANNFREGEPLLPEAPPSSPEEGEIPAEFPESPDLSDID